MATSKTVRHTFQTVTDQSSLGVFVKYTIEGVADHAGFGRDRIEAAVAAHGLAAARQLLEHLKNLHTKANCSSAEEFIIGYVPISESKNPDLASWDALQADVFALMMTDLSKVEPFDLGKGLIAAIRKAADFASPRLRAWGVED